jgi:hypothetical protein
MIRAAGAVLSFVTMCLVLLVTGCSEQSSDTSAKSDAGWLTKTPDETARFELIQKQFRGFDVAMWEVGQRYRALHDALTRNNYDLALYHWDKIKTAIDNGTLRRPARKASADELFFPYWDEIRQEIAARDESRAWIAFERATTACQSCHQAEKVAYMNDQALFDLGRPAGTQ